MTDEALRNIIRGADLADREDVQIRMSLATVLRECLRFAARGDDDRATTAPRLQGWSASATGVSQ
jgi:hypothetical protein